MLDRYKTKHGKKRVPPRFVCTARAISHGYIRPRHGKDMTGKRKLYQTLCTLIAVLIAADTILFGMHVTSLAPYAITSGKQTICYVKNKREAKKAIVESTRALTRKNEEDKILETKTNLQFRKAAVSERPKVTDRPIDVIVEKAKEENTPIRIEAKVIRTEEVERIPETVCEADDELMAGETEVIEDGKPGREVLKVGCTMTNGETTEEHELSSEVIEQGETKIIKKGTKGLPEGESYEAYEGYPENRIAEEVMKTASEYEGKTPYVWGGKDLQTGVDCSGFVIAVYALHDIQLGYPLEEEGISVPYEEAKPGDILCFPGHFGLYLGEGRMIHASEPGTYVMESDIGDREILDVRRIIVSSDKESTQEEDSSN